MAATKDNPVVFYDLVGKNGISFSLNTYKTRLSLDYKGIPYRVEYLSLPDIEPKMKELGVPPSSDNHPRYTIPMIADPSNDKYPAPKYPAIFALGTRSLQHLIVTQYFPTIGIDRIFESHEGDRTKPLPDDVAAQKWEQVRAKFAAFSKSLQLNDGTKDEGPFIMGNIVSFWILLLEEWSIGSKALKERIQLD
ncbi:Glutathione S-transferase, N-terminal domain [Rhizoctonia solani]|uniref:Glutathione S-transferase, N-terminal domain n=1 Tax=Rhizoctonia solani TaxID=456999 RepID=A0A8H7IJ32_9AGAM|nr:Glutathione S-transferase, N-terminal domain [Rhizoctonia solani]